MIPVREDDEWQAVKNTRVPMLGTAEYKGGCLDGRMNKDKISLRGCRSMVIASTQAALSSGYHGLLAEKQKGSRFDTRNI